MVIYTMTNIGSMTNLAQLALCLLAMAVYQISAEPMWWTLWNGEFEQDKGQEFLASFNEQDDLNMHINCSTTSGSTKPFFIKKIHQSIKLFVTIDVFEYPNNGNFSCFLENDKEKSEPSVVDYMDEFFPKYFKGYCEKTDNAKCRNIVHKKNFAMLASLGADTVNLILDRICFNVNNTDIEDSRCQEFATFTNHTETVTKASHFSSSRRILKLLGDENGFLNGRETFARLAKYRITADCSNNKLFQCDEFDMIIQQTKYLFNTAQFICSNEDATLCSKFLEMCKTKNLSEYSDFVKTHCIKESDIVASLENARFCSKVREYHCKSSSPQEFCSYLHPLDKFVQAPAVNKMNEDNFKNITRDVIVLYELDSEKYKTLLQPYYGNRLGVKGLLYWFCNNRSDLVGEKDCIEAFENLRKLKKNVQHEIHSQTCLNPDVIMEYFKMCKTENRKMCDSIPDDCQHIKAIYDDLVATQYLSANGTGNSQENKDVLLRFANRCESDRKYAFCQRLLGYFLENYISLYDQVEKDVLLENKIAKILLEETCGTGSEKKECRQILNKINQRERYIETFHVLCTNSQEWSGPICTAMMSQCPNLLGDCSSLQTTESPLNYSPKGNICTLYLSILLFVVKLFI